MRTPVDPNKPVDRQVSEWFAQGDLLFEHGQEPLAAGYYQWITEVEPANARAWRMLGLCCLTGLGGERNALRALQKAVALDPYDEQARGALENLQRRLAQNPYLLDKGERQFREITDEFLARARLEGGDAAARTSAPSRAASSEASTESDGGPESWPADRQLFFAEAMWNGGEYSEALGVCDRVLVREPGSFRASLMRAACLAELGQTDTAVRLLEDLAKERPDSVEVWHNLGAAHARSRRPQSALDCYRRASELDPERAETWAQMAATYYEMSPREHAEQALDWVARAIALAPASGRAYGLRARILDDLGRDTEALLFYDRCLGSCPGDQGAMYGRGLVLLKLERPLEAARQFEELTAVAPDCEGAWNNLAVSLFVGGRESEAMAAITKAVARFPDSLSLFITWGDLRAKQKGMEGLSAADEHERERLQSDLRVALTRLRLETHADDPLLWSALANEYLGLEDYESAEEALVKAAESGSSQGSDWYYLAAFAEERDEHHRALSHTEKALELGFEDPELWFVRGTAYGAVGNLLESRRCLRRTVAGGPTDGAYVDALNAIEARILEVREAHDVSVLQWCVTCATCGAHASAELTLIGYEACCSQCDGPVLSAHDERLLHNLLADRGLEVPSG